ncbi:MAG: hypothetical protein A3H93_05940 [Rhodocyclales bacterium RIFCSPLOWO2_02_FULL_63_24]|nr:MAG: hypothetical protein A3H93_05940 [Rhodocyclales bacterium RIFCSPLOWO2_02_FULL_63_24]
MIGLGDIARSLDAFSAQTAAAPAKTSSPLPERIVAGQAVEAQESADRISISPEAVQQLQLDRELEAEQAAARKAAGEDVELAARMAHDIAYRREVVVVPPADYTNLPTSLYLGGGSPGSNSASIAKAQSELDQARLARIALYELEKSRGTPPAEIYDRLLSLGTARSIGYRISIAA